MVWSTRGKSAGLALLVMLAAGLLAPALSCNERSIGAVDGTRAGAQEQAPAAKDEASARATGLPRLVDYGAEFCIPCRQMMPILGKLASDFKGIMEVEVVNVYKEMNRARAAGVRLIPTQIFYGPDGTELSRHEGFMSREDILAEWKRLGYDFGEPEEEA